MASKLGKKGHSPDYVILSLIFILVIFGLVMLASASSELGKKNFNDTYYYIKHQLLYGLSFGILGFFLASKLYYRYYQKFAVVLLLLSLGALVLVFTSFGHTAGGAGRWLKLGPIIFQPAELLKLTYIIYLAAWLSNSRKGREGNFFEGFMPFLIITGLIGGLLVLQPATSTVVILVSAGLGTYFLSGAKLKFIALVGLLGIAGFALLIYLTPYRLARIEVFFNRDQDIEGNGHQINEALITLGSGGLWGSGYGQSTSKFGRLPASVNDSIFAVIGSELGFVGAGTLVVLFAFLSLRILWLAKDFRDHFGQLVLVGFAIIIGLQAFVNMAAISGLLPLTGIPLPFISFGGTALAVFLTMGGIINNISKHS
ncbi:MAG: FtsW/RodA/SpoVE family cell cycle protein [Patescibacteria group bacterium]